MRVRYRVYCAQPWGGGTRLSGGDLDGVSGLDDAVDDDSGGGPSFGCRVPVKRRRIPRHSRPSFFFLYACLLRVHRKA